VYATNKTGSISDDWIYYQVVIHLLLITLKHWQFSTISHLHNLHFTVAIFFHHELPLPISYQKLIWSCWELLWAELLQEPNWTGRELLLNSLLQLMCVHWLVLNWTAFSLSYKRWRLTCGRTQCCVLLSVTSRRSHDPSLLLRDPVFTA
jgi:hypothetical protein